MARETITKSSKNQAICSVCGKSPTSGYTRSHSMRQIKRTVKPNVQKIQGQILCTRCLRTSSKRKTL